MSCNTDIHLNKYISDNCPIIFYRLPYILCTLKSSLAKLEGFMLWSPEKQKITAYSSHTIQAMFEHLGTLWDFKTTFKSKFNSPLYFKLQLLILFTFH